MNTEDIIDEIQYLKKKTVLLEKLLNTKQNEQSIITTIQPYVVSNDLNNETTNSYKKRSIC